ncbi:hypothetical protein SAMN04487843_12338 [Methylobacterium sp. ap11]|uniref:hypothetical protein n=1 Tax=Methylobacterium sp. ap11 TaxID=1761799 RepID=UPI0008CE05E3|nr:hypothetical protein [Methylobacterium sp. ap11]SEP46262.1 hypothetical protein SAMN04487843_12338 [Methylobacterium sp. ap11]
MTPITERDRAFLEREWRDLGGFVVQDDPDPADHDAIHAWVLDFIDSGVDDPDDPYVHGLIGHSLDFDIPFAATERVRGELMTIARRKRADPGWRRHP